VKWVNFRNACDTTRLKMKLRDAHGLRMAEDAEHVGGPVWVRREDFPGCLDHLPAEKPAKVGTMVRPSAIRK
jgi:hypothetical protein